MDTDTEKHDAPLERWVLLLWVSTTPPTKSIMSESDLKFLPNNKHEAKWENQWEPVKILRRYVEREPLEYVEVNLDGTIDYAPNRRRDVCPKTYIRYRESVQQNVNGFSRETISHLNNINTLCEASTSSINVYNNVVNQDFIEPINECEKDVLCTFSTTEQIRLNETLNVSTPVFCATPNFKTEINSEKVDGSNDRNELVSLEVHLLPDSMNEYPFFKINKKSLDTFVSNHQHRIHKTNAFINFFLTSFVQSDKLGSMTLRDLRKTTSIYEPMLEYLNRYVCPNKPISTKKYNSSISTVLFNLRNSGNINNTTPKKRKSSAKNEICCIKKIRES